MDRCRNLSGISFAQLAHRVGVSFPENPSHRKGYIGLMLELALGCDAGNESAPDFSGLGVELKTIPIAASGSPAESTFVSSIPLLTIHQQTWKTSQCYAKLKRVLWIPVEGDKSIPFSQRRVGNGILWSPTSSQEATLEEDWTYLTDKIIAGDLESLDASVGTYLQVRPKAANGKSLSYCYDAKGNKVQTLPRGFYLRTQLTSSVLALENVL
ncbi:DNA mismatch repair endonuclease MutH [Legionella waltersii]